MIDLAILNAGAGDYKAEFDTEDAAAGEQLEGFIADMLVKGFALFLEDGEETHRILSFDRTAQTFEVVSARKKGGRATIQVRDVPPAGAPEGAQRGRGRPRRVTAVAPTAGG